ncbi:MAG: lamin tail domain-containing protein, partial [Sedimentisphaerales bacterium]|nr:lamin tail domain-containing protein [Sedimentisphaerales bacterium]
APPKLRQVEHNPATPDSNESVRITVKVTDEDGVESVTLQYRIVEPGHYCYKLDPEYETGWIDLPMFDDGTHGDQDGGDDVYTVLIPPSVQQHRRLIRYRIAAVDGKGAPAIGPRSDDPSPNFAYFVYNGVPAWTGAWNGSSVNNVTYSPEVLTSVPVYHLISKKDDVEHATWIDRYGGEDYLWWGTLVYDGQVYDHIRYRMRGGVWRYAMGKNMWKFDFNRGRYFQARDDYGRKYDTQWDKLNFSACIQQGDYQHRGEQGMFEAATFKMFNLMGVEAPKTHWFHFRIIDEAAETGSTQYNGDFWGLYMAIEQMDGRFLDEHGLPDGNLYKIEDHNAQMPPNNQGYTGVTDASDFNAFRNILYSAPPESWWRANVNLESYYGYRCVVEGAHHGDIAYGKNYFFYLNPETNIWTMYPWDVDLTWANNMYGNGEEVYKQQGNIFSKTNLKLEFYNRYREFIDLLYNTDEMYRLLDEMAVIIDDPAGGPSIVDADRAMWDYNPIMTSSYINPGKAGQGRFYQQAATKDFPGMVQIMKNYVTGYRSFNTYRNEESYENGQIPNTPTVTYTGTPGYPINDLTFRTTAFSDPQGNGTFAAMQWRIAEIAPATQDKPGIYEIETLWKQDSIDFVAEIRIPAGEVKVDHTYRVRVKMKDTSGRWSHWSAPIEFAAGAPLPQPVLDDLRITEIMYHPAPAWPYDQEEYEYIELKNIGQDAVDLESSQFTEGISYAFPQGTELSGGQYLILAKNPDAFFHRYPQTGQEVVVLGPYEGFLANTGENLRLQDYNQGIIARFEYKDGWYPITDGDGFSLTLRDPFYQSQEGQAPAEGLQGHWRFDETTGFTAADETGSYPGTLVNMTPGNWVPGKFGNALDFNGTNQYVLMQSFSGITGGNPRTVSAWIRTGTKKAADILSWGSTASGGKWLLQIQNIHSLPGTLKLDVGGGYVVGSTILWDGKWHHVTAVLSEDGTPNAEDIRLYVDGQPEPISSVVPRNISTSSSVKVKVGIFSDGSNRYFEGQIDNVCIYNRALSSDEINQMAATASIYDQKQYWRPSAMAGGSPGFDDSDILPAPGSIVINEVLAHSHELEPDWIELYNTTDEPIHIGGWFLSDDASEPNRTKYEIAEGTVIEGHDYLVFYEDIHFGPAATGPGIRHEPFSLSEGGELVHLQSAA